MMSDFIPMRLGERRSVRRGQTAAEDRFGPLLCVDRRDQRVGPFLAHDRRWNLKHQRHGPISTRYLPPAFHSHLSTTALEPQDRPLLPYIIHIDKYILYT